jgi:hypothetical protein
MKIDCSAGPPFSPAKVSDAQERALVADEGAQMARRFFHGIPSGRICIIYNRNENRACFLNITSRALGMLRQG